MATAVEFPERNDYMGKPETLSNNQCYALPIARILTYIPGVIDRAPLKQVHAHVSCWQLTEEELEQVKRTGKVFLKVIGTSTFPLSIHGQLPIYTGDTQTSDKLFTEDEVKTLKGQG